MIHPSAIISKKTIIGENVTIGPFCVIGDDVIIGNNVTLKSHVVIEGKTKIGDNNIIYPFASIGQIPQDLKYKGEESEVIIGNNNTIREYVTIQSGTKGGNMITKVGDNNLFMVGVHIAHDCVIGNHIVLANYVSLAGHVIVEDYVIIGGMSGVLQYIHIGRYAMIGGMSGVDGNVIPFALIKGERATLETLNLVGMQRHGFSNSDSLEAVEAINILFNKDPQLFVNKIANIKGAYQNNIIIKHIIDFLENKSNKRLCGINIKN